MSEPVLLEIRNVSKNFGVTQALSDVSLVVEKGTVHSLLGRNGAGKSTLVNIIAGLYPQTSGTVVFEGKDIKELNIFERQTLGIKLVPQHENIIPHLSIAENIFLGILPVKGNRLVDWKTMNELADKELKKYGLDVDPTMEARKLSSVDTRKLNIIRAMYGGAKLIILDEPTTALSNKERNELFAFVNELKAKGTAFI
ncbi:MAG: ATP-binding cassette domain-containing protein, partial [Christensenella sp.]